VFGLGQATRIYLAAGVTDLRKGFEGRYGPVRDRLSDFTARGLQMAENKGVNPVGFAFDWVYTLDLKDRDLTGELESSRARSDTSPGFHLYLFVQSRMMSTAVPVSGCSGSG